MSHFKKGQQVRFTARVQSGTGKIIGVRKSVTNSTWYDVKKNDGTTISLRAANLQAA